MNTHRSLLTSAKNAAQQALSMQRALNKRFSYIIFFPEMIPKFAEDDFAIDQWKIPSYVFYVLVPVGFAVWLIRYRKLAALQEKLSLTETKLNTGIFYLNALDY